MSTTAEWLGRAASWRFASLLFRPPTPEIDVELRSLAGELPEEYREAARRFAAFGCAERDVEYHRVLGPGGCPASESSYDDSAFAGRGPLLAEVSGFYRAFAFEPGADLAEVPDHASVELGFLSYLAVKSAFAAHEGRAAELDVASGAYLRFRDEHPRFWFGRFAARLAEADSPFFADAARWALDHESGARGAAPMQAIELLSQEHRSIESVLDSLETFTGRLESEGERRALREYASFLRSFADRRHHGKEEDILFRSMMQHGFPRDAGPLAVMLAEHDQGRAHVAVLARIGDGEGPLSAAERAEAAAEARRFIALLRDHIRKEDHILYPMAVEALPPDELDRIARRFAELETAEAGGGIEAFRAAANALSSPYSVEASCERT